MQFADWPWPGSFNCPTKNEGRFLATVEHYFPIWGWMKRGVAGPWRSAPAKRAVSACSTIADAEVRNASSSDSSALPRDVDRIEPLLTDNTTPASRYPSIAWSRTTRFRFATLRSSPCCSSPAAAV